MKDKHFGKKMQAAYESFLSTVKRYSMEDKIAGGVLVGFSGGPDSLLLLYLLLRYKKEHPFALAAVHVHHGIRGEAADRDAMFAQNVCEDLGVEFIAQKVDVPTVAKETKTGLEEAARNERYSCFDNIISSRKDISTIALGHNATDNAETVIFHLMRGCGTGGLAGIPPVRDWVIRPLISLSKNEILDALNEEGIAYTLDETNNDTAYTRNFIRHKILPLLSHISTSVEVSVAKVCRNLMSDNDYLEREAAKAYANMTEDRGERATLAELHPAILSRVLARWAKKYGTSLEQTHIDSLRALIAKGECFHCDLPGGVRFISDGRFCYFSKEKKPIAVHSDYLIRVAPEHPIPLDCGQFLITNDLSHNCCTNIYNFSIKANLRSAIIKGELFIRNKRDGDSYYYGKMTHKLKKLFNDKKIPLQIRETLPVLCDEKGIVWVPGFGVRDDGGSNDNAFTAVFFY